MKKIRASKIISGGQSGADLAGNAWAKEVGLESEINIHKDFFPINPSIAEMSTFHTTRKNVVSEKTGIAGLIERRKYNVAKSNATIIFVEKPIGQTRGSLGTLLDANSMKKDCLVIDFSGAKMHELIQLFDDFIKDKNPRVINIAGQRDMKSGKTIDLLNKSSLGVSLRGKKRKPR